MSIRWTNNAASVLASDITAGTLSITVTTGHGDRFPEVVAPHYCMVTLIDSSGNREIVKVTARDSASNTLTITRAQEGTSARSFAAGSLVELRITKNAMDELSKAADINSQHYVCDASAADQGATTNTASLKSIVDALGATEEATIDLPHTGTGDTTTYTVGTNLTIPATVTLRAHKGVRISPSGGVTLTVNGIVQAGAFQIFAGAGTVTVSTYPQDQAWWGSAQRLDVTGLSVGTKTLSVMPPGVILPYGGASAPSGWLLCYGQTVSQATYADLYAIIGHTFGADPGGGNFILPDMRGRIPLGKDNMGGSSANRITDTEADTVGSAAGSENHLHTTGDVTLAASQSGLPKHRHVAPGKLSNTGSSPTGFSQGVNDGETIVTGYAYEGDDLAASSPHNHGNTQTVDHTMPYLTSNYIIKY